MQVKRYQAADMREAMDDIVRELGTEAVVLSSRKVRQKGMTGLFKKPVLEVMVAYDPARGSHGSSGTAATAAPAPVIPVGARDAVAAYGKHMGSAPNPPPPERKKPDSPGEGERVVDNLGERIEVLDQMLTDAIDKLSYGRPATAGQLSDEVARLYCRLKENQVEEELAAELARQTEDAAAGEDADAAGIMRELIARQMGDPMPIQTKKYARKVILFLGPTGVGKTTSLVKLAADFTLGQGKKVGIINTDTYRIAAQEQLRTYADLLNIPIHVVYKIEEIGGALERLSDRDIILIDTAGKRPGDEGHRKDVEQLLELACPEDVMLCVSATTGFSAIKEVLDTYAFVDNARLIITKMDETRYHGIVLNTSWYSGRSLAYVTTGQNVPDDIGAADTAQMAEALLRKT